MSPRTTTTAAHRASQPRAVFATAAYTAVAPSIRPFQLPSVHSTPQHACRCRVTAGPSAPQAVHPGLSVGGPGASAYHTDRPTTRWP